MSTSRLPNLDMLTSMEDLSLSGPFDVVKTPEQEFNFERRRWISMKNDVNKLIEFLKIYQDKRITIDSGLYDECKFIGLIDKGKILELGELFLSFESGEQEQIIVKIIKVMCKKDKKFLKKIIELDLSIDNFAISQDENRLIVHFKLLEMVGVLKQVTCGREFSIYKIINKDVFQIIIEYLNNHKVATRVAWAKILSGFISEQLPK